MSQPPYFDIEYWRSYRLILSKKLQLIKIKSHYYCATLLHVIPHKKLSDWHGFRSTADSSGHFDYSYAHIYQLNAEDFVVEIHAPQWFSLFSQNSKKLAFTQFFLCIILKIKKVAAIWCKYFVFCSTVIF